MKKSSHFKNERKRWPSAVHFFHKVAEMGLHYSEHKFGSF